MAILRLPWPLLVQAPLSFPDVPIDEDAKDLITQLLARDVVDRIGCRKGGSQEVKDHSFFRDLSWEDLLAKKVTLASLCHRRGDGVRD